MAILINWKICDNAKECDGLAACPTGALSWDNKKKSLKIDNKKCISCGRCKRACTAEAIYVAKNEEDYEKIKKQISKDKRLISELFIDKYGASPISTDFIIKKDRLDTEILETSKTVILEIFDGNTTACLIRSIPIKNLVRSKDIKYCKLDIGDDKIVMPKFKIKKLPSLVIFKKGKIIGKIEGYYSVDEKAKFKEKIDKILKK